MGAYLKTKAFGFILVRIGLSQACVPIKKLKKKKKKKKKSGN